MFLIYIILQNELINVLLEPLTESFKELRLLCFNKALTPLLLKYAYPYPFVSVALYLCITWFRCSDWLTSHSRIFKMITVMTSNRISKTHSKVSLIASALHII